MSQPRFVWMVAWGLAALGAEPGCQPAEPRFASAQAQGPARATDGSMSRLVEIRSYNLKPGSRARFHERFVKTSLPLLERWKVDVVAYGPSLHDADSYFLIRAYASLEERQRSEDSFYASAEWRAGPREATLADIASYTTLVLPVDPATLRGLRRTGTEGDRSSAQPSDREQLLLLNARYIESFLKADVAWYREHLAEGFVCIDGTGSVLDKAAFLEDTARGPGVADYVLADIRVHQYGDTALLQGRGVYKRRDGTTGSSRYIDVYVRMDGTWKVVSAQITRSAT